MTTRFRKTLLGAAVATTCLGSALTQASSHREAPFITGSPKVDATDFYMFRSYESGREGYVTLIANYLPLQDAYGGPNYFQLDTDAVYEIHVDNNADAVEDLTFRFSFDTITTPIELDVNGSMVAIPLKNAGEIGPAADATATVQSRQEFSVDLIRGDRRTGTVQAVTNRADGSTQFRKPVDNIGNKSIPDYAAYAGNHVYEIAIPGCTSPGKVFVGQRKEAFAVNLGEIFDLVNLSVAEVTGPRNALGNDLADKNVTSLALEVPTSCLTAGADIIGGWTTASLPQARVLNPMPAKAASQAGKGPSVSGGALTQVSRLGSPLVNEVVIGLPDKDRFNTSEPKDDGQFATYVTNPTLPELIESLFGVEAPNTFPRADLVAAFLTGVDGVNQPAGVTTSEMLRLNTAIAVTPAGSQNDLGVIGGDNAGFPNGRRPVDDVVDIALRVSMGVLLPDHAAAAEVLTDGAQLDPSELMAGFPYLATPLAGSVIE